jgi:hypothetical protein
LLRDNDNCPGKLIEVHLPERNAGKLQVCAPPLFLGPEKNDTGVIPRRMVSQIGKSFVGGNQPSTLTLNPRPEDVIVPRPASPVRRR